MTAQPCARCGSAPRQVYSTGRVSPYCAPCKSYTRKHRLTAATRRRDGLCPRCGTHPRRRSSTGRIYAYCLSCLRVPDEQRQVRKDGICARCGTNPRPARADGSLRGWCRACEVTQKADYARTPAGKATWQRYVARVAAGVIDTPCARCKANPRKVYPSGPSAYCPACTNTIARERTAARRG